MRLMAEPFVILHAGAGYHPESTIKLLSSLCEESCSQALRVLKEGGSSQEAVSCAIAILEDSPQTNCGYGSNLTINGGVECDASIMCGQTGCYGSVGAVTGMKNPIKIASRLLSQQQKGPMSLGRIPPMMLAGGGATSYATQNNIQVLPANDLICDRARAIYVDHMKRLERVNETIPTAKKARFDQPSVVAQDTVGAIAVDEQGVLCAGASSGGLSLKLPGRVGHAAMYGCGCWAQNSSVEDTPGFACSVSGAGEHIARTLLAKECCSYYQSRSDSPLKLHDFLQEHFLSHPFLHDVTEKNCGLIVVQKFKDYCELSWGHTTSSFCVAYQGMDCIKPQVVFSRLESSLTSGRTVQIGAVCLSKKID